jgi:hypothetical protein
MDIETAAKLLQLLITFIGIPFGAWLAWKATARHRREERRIEAWARYLGACQNLVEAKRGFELHREMVLTSSRRSDSEYVSKRSDESTAALVGAVGALRTAEVLLRFSETDAERCRFVDQLSEVVSKAWQSDQETVHQLADVQIRFVAEGIADPKKKGELARRLLSVDPSAIDSLLHSPGKGGK